MSEPFRDDPNNALLRLEDLERDKIELLEEVDELQSQVAAAVERPDTARNQIANLQDENARLRTELAESKEATRKARGDVRMMILTAVLATAAIIAIIFVLTRT
ncbi:MAG: hypothetical protein ABI183_03925 [Polyangiaceae bacterium]